MVSSRPVSGVIFLRVGLEVLPFASKAPPAAANLVQICVIEN